MPPFFCIFSSLFEEFIGHLSLRILDPTSFDLFEMTSVKQRDKQTERTEATWLLFFQEGASVNGSLTMFMTKP